MSAKPTFPRREAIAPAARLQTLVDAWYIAPGHARAQASARLARRTPYLVLNWLPRRRAASRARWAPRDPFWSEARRCCGAPEERCASGGSHLPTQRVKKIRFAHAAKPCSGILLVGSRWPSACSEAAPVSSRSRAAPDARSPHRKASRRPHCAATDGTKRRATPSSWQTLPPSRIRANDWESGRRLGHSPCQPGRQVEEGTL